VGSSPDKAPDFFNLPNSSSHTMALGIYSTSNKNKYQKIFLGNKTRLLRKADNLTAICEPIV
jgi:hypothetical protein